MYISDILEDKVVKTIFTITSFNTKEKQLCLLVRDSAEEAKMQIDNEINLLKKTRKYIRG